MKLRSYSPLSGIEELDNQRCPKCNEVYDYDTLLHIGVDGQKTYPYRLFERQNHVCKK